MCGLGPRDSSKPPGGGGRPPPGRWASAPLVRLLSDAGGCSVVQQLEDFAGVQLPLRPPQLLQALLLELWRRADLHTFSGKRTNPVGFLTFAVQRCFQKFVLLSFSDRSHRRQTKTDYCLRFH